MTSCHLVFGSKGPNLSSGRGALVPPDSAHITTDLPYYCYYKHVFVFNQFHQHMKFVSIYNLGLCRIVASMQCKRRTFG